MIDVMEEYYKKIEGTTLNESCTKKSRKKVNEGNEQGVHPVNQYINQDEIKPFTTWEDEFKAAGEDNFSDYLYDMDVELDDMKNAVKNNKLADIIFDNFFESYALNNCFTKDVMGKQEHYKPIIKELLIDDLKETIDNDKKGWKKLKKAIKNGDYNYFDDDYDESLNYTSKSVLSTKNESCNKRTAKKVNEENEQGNHPVNKYINMEKVDPFTTWEDEFKSSGNNNFIDYLLEGEDFDDIKDAVEADKIEEFLFDSFYKVYVDNNFFIDEVVNDPEKYKPIIKELLWGELVDTIANDNIGWERYDERVNERNAYYDDYYDEGPSYTLDYNYPWVNADGL